METSKYKDRLGKQYKSLSFYAKEIQYDSGSRTISGYAAIFNNIDKAGDMLLKGCFSKSIQERGPESSANDKIVNILVNNPLTPKYSTDKYLIKTVLVIKLIKTVST